MEHQALATAAGGAQLDHLGLALAHLLDDDAGMLLVDVDHDLFDRLQHVAGLSSFFMTTRGREMPSSKPSRRMVSMRTASCSSPRPET